MLLIAGMTCLDATAQNTTTGTAPIYNGNSVNKRNNTNGTNKTTTPANGTQNLNNTNNTYRSHYQPTATKPATITPAQNTTPNNTNNTPGMPVNTTPATR